MFRYKFSLDINFRDKKRKIEEAHKVLDALSERFPLVEWDGCDLKGYDILITMDIDKTVVSDWYFLKVKEEAFNIVKKALDKLEGGE